MQVKDGLDIFKFLPVLSWIDLNVDMLFDKKKKLILFKIQMVKIGNDGFAAHEKNSIRHRRTREASLPASPLF